MFERWARCGVVLLSAAVLAPLPAVAQTGASQLRTRWAAGVTVEHVLSGYPRPQLVRHDWINLNGLWDYAISPRDSAQPEHWDGPILVPFPVESQLSAVTRPVTDSERLWYHRTFRVSQLGHDQHLLLHFGAVDWQAAVWVNGVAVGTHTGGYDPFTFDITDALHGNGDQELVVSVWDPTDKGSQPRGKQVLNPNGIWYTAVTGIWQTVWLEPVPGPHITTLYAVPDIDAGTVTLHATADGVAPTASLRATVLADGKVVTQGDGPVNQPLVLSVPTPHLWSPDDPYLYHLQVILAGRDTVRSYFGMRKISIGHDARGTARLFLNNHQLFEFGTLDQGWWPGGLYTAPTDSALRYDMVTMKQLGFNLMRKHVKVEPARWYYDADSLGMLIWQDMPSGDNKTDAAKQDFSEELRHVVDALRDHPSIVMWIPFNEGWGQHDTEKIVAWLKNYDPSRLVDDASGWTDKGVGDVADLHSYPGPGMPATSTTRAAVLGEFGGLGLPLEGHTWLAKNNWGYRSYTTREQLDTAYIDLLTQLRWLEADGLSAAVYTQTTDVENEVNGLMTYDRAIIKLLPDARQAAAALFGPAPRAMTLLATSRTFPQQWRYTTVAPDSTWYRPDFDDSTWTAGVGGFGTRDTPGSVVRTAWKTSDIWLRRSFDIPALQFTNLQWNVHHDEDADIYVNGKLVATLKGYTTGYMHIPLNATARAALRVGPNLLAVHVHQTRGGQYIDLGLDEVIDR
jgi:Glycosyl hydrolases family 2, sugar binding domain/Glycosyl hydrolases family 2/Glycosyl hydrolases family 2, TIM barrel domain